MFGMWLNNQHKDFKPMIWVGVSAICWAIWKRRNDIVFKKTKFNSFLQVIFRGDYWLRFWAQLQRKEQAKDTLIAMSRKLEVVALQFANGGWNNFFVYLSRGLIALFCLFLPFRGMFFSTL
jgi:hypothetical protein